MAIFENEVQRQFNELLEDCSHFNETEKTLVIKSYEFASEAHKGVRRKSGEPYIIHPLSVAKIAVVEIGLGAKAIAAALLHDVVEDTQYTLEDIENSFGKEIAVIVDGLTKISGVFHENISAQAENFRKILLTISEDVRVILIKLADRLHNMRTLDSMAPHKQMKIAGETIYFFVPLANRFGLYEIKKELENLSLKYRFPTIYREIQNKMLEYENIREFYINNFVKPLRDKLDKDGYRYVIIREPRSIYSIWLEMQTENLSFEQVYDALSLTIVFEPHPEIPEKTQCWAIYALITDVYIPKPECLRDYVSKPKANGYEALHATFMGPNGKWVDVFIRSIRMNMIAERGFAPMLEKRNFSEDAELTKWMDKLSSYLSEQNENAVEFVDDFTLNLYSQEILVFTPKGQLRTLPLGSTVLDFAFDIHSEIGFKSIAAK